MDIGNKHNEYKTSSYTNRWVQSDTPTCVDGKATQAGRLNSMVHSGVPHTRNSELTLFCASKHINDDRDFMMHSSTPAVYLKWI